MSQSLMVSSRSFAGPRTPWQKDPALVRQYLRIYWEVKKCRQSVTLVASDYGYTRRHIYWIVGQVKESGLVKE